MAKEFKDFTFKDKKFSQLPFKCISVDFEQDSEIPLGLEKDMEVGESTRYRLEPNYFYDKYTGTLEFEMDIVKDPCTYPNQADMEFTKSDIRKFTGWLTSAHYPSWLNLECERDDETLDYKGFFSNIESWVVAGRTFGLKLHFKCTTPFAWTREIIETVESTTNSSTSFLITNDTDDENGYYYPRLTIKPHETGDIYICNMSDCNMIKNGTLKKTTTYFDAMIAEIKDYANLHKYEIKYINENNDSTPLPLCNDTVVQFSYVDVYGLEKKYTAFYLENTGEYRIIENGFFYLKVQRDNNLEIDCRELVITNEARSIVTYDELGIKSVGHLYFPRLIAGYNSLLIYGNCDIEIEYREARKVGA